MRSACLTWSEKPASAGPKLEKNAVRVVGFHRSVESCGAIGGKG